MKYMQTLEVWRGNLCRQKPGGKSAVHRGNSQQQNLQGRYVAGKF